MTDMICIRRRRIEKGMLQCFSQRDAQVLVGFQHQTEQMTQTTRLDCFGEVRLTLLTDGLDLIEHLFGCVTRKGEATGAEQESADTDGPDIDLGALVALLIVDFGRAVVAGTKVIAKGAETLDIRFSEAKVAQFQGAVGLVEDVLQLDVLVDDAGAMEDANAVDNLGHHVAHSAVGEDQPAAARQVVGFALAQGAAAARAAQRFRSVHQVAEQGARNPLHADENAVLP